MRRINRSSVQFITIILSLAMTFGIGTSALATSENAYTKEDPAVSIEDNKDTNETGEPDGTKTPNITEETAAMEEDAADTGTYDNGSAPATMPDIPTNEEESRQLEGNGFGAEYYTFFPNLMTTGFGQGLFLKEPESGPDIRTVFRYFVGNTQVDSIYPNVAIATLDKTFQFGAMWAGEKLDLNLPFSTKMYLHLGHSVSPANTAAVADGMTFTMHNYELALTQMIGGRGEGLGVWTGRDSSARSDGEFLPDSLVIEFDTYINNDRWSTVLDPVSDDPVKYAHCALIYPRENDTLDISDIPGPITVNEHKNTSYFEPTQEWIPFTLNWEPEYDDRGTLGGTLTYTFNGVTQVEKITDVESVFNGTEVWWGFTGATGAQTAVQAAAITKLPSPQYNIDVEKSVENVNKENIDGKYANAGDILTYTIRATGSMTADGAGIGPIRIQDKLPEYVEYIRSDITVTMSDGSGSFTVEPVFDEDTLTLIVDTDCTLEESKDWLEITFTVKVKENTAVGTVVKNTAEAKADNLENPVESNTTQVTITKTSRKTVAMDSAAGVDGAEVTIGDFITYEIVYVNNTEGAANLTITDFLHQGVEYKRHSDTIGHTGDGGNYDEDSHTVIWKISGVPPGESGSVTVTVKVKADIDLVSIDKLTNTAKLIWSTAPDTPEELNTKNPVTGHKATYYGNGGRTTGNDDTYTEGYFAAGSDYPVQGNNRIGFIKDGYIFKGWNTEASGLGNSYAASDIITGVMEDIDLYAQWAPVIDLTLKKVDAAYYDTEDPLAGATFELYTCTEDSHTNAENHNDYSVQNSCWKKVGNDTSDDDGLLTFAKLETGTYLLVEIKAPNGYELPKGQWIITVNAIDKTITSNGTLGSNDIPALKILYDGRADLAVGNFANRTLPTLGGEGTFWLAVLGGVLLIGGIAFMFGYRRAKRTILQNI